MHVESVGERCCLFMELKTACYTIASFLLLNQVSGMVVAFLLFTTKKDINMMIETDFKDCTGNVIFLLVAIALLFVVLNAFTSFTVMLIAGLYKKDPRLMKIDLVFSSFILTISVIYCFVCEFVFVVNPSVTLHKVLTLVNAAFLSVIRSCWTKLERENHKLEQCA